MNHKTYYKTAATIFGIAALLHFLRVLNAWEAVIGTFTIPMWFSYAFMLIAGYMALRGFALSRK